jgi:hypothetical protein
MLLPPHRTNDEREGFKIAPLDHWWMLLEEGQNCAFQAPESVDSNRQDAAVRTLGAHAPTAEDWSHRLENISMVAVLVDVEHRLELPPAVPTHHRRSMH